jgi:hypothetical protein
MLGVSILPLSTIFLLDCGTVLVFHFIHITFYFIGKILLFLMKLCHYYWSKLLRGRGKLMLWGRTVRLSEMCVGEGRGVS